uniref:SWIB/MDM2 domain-containing protein n=1 Tax=Panagrellus redivivus TaxID=6233 RepID=A0A7E4UR55_PANRE
MQQRGMNNGRYSHAQQGKRGQNAAAAAAAAAANNQLPPAPFANPMNRPNQRNKRRRNLDRSIMNEIAMAYPEGKSYVDLLGIEAHLDALLMRKRLAIQESLKRPMKQKKKLRIYISHVFQSPPERDLDLHTPSTWELRVEGRMLDDCPPNQVDLPPSQMSSAQNMAANRSKRKFSSFFKSLVIELDKHVYGPDNHLVEWHRGPQTNETDGFQVKRPGDRDVRCTILLSLDHQPMKYKIHPRLAKLLGIALETRSKVIEALWQYIKTHKLQDTTDREFINCDHMLEQIFNVKRMRFLEVPNRVQHLLSTPDPIVLNHIIRRNDSEKPVTACYDIDVEIEDPLKAPMTHFLQNMTNVNDIQHLDNKLYDLAEQVSEWKLRVDYYRRMADDPQGFVQKWLKSQENDLKVITGKNAETESERHVERYLQPQMQEGVFRYLYNKVQQRRKELEMGINSKSLY